MLVILARAQSIIYMHRNTAASPSSIAVSRIQVAILMYYQYIPVAWLNSFLAFEANICSIHILFITTFHNSFFIYS